MLFPILLIGRIPIAGLPTTKLNSSTVSNPSAQPDYTTNYVVAITSDSGCTIKDGLRIVVKGQGPLVSITADKYKGCLGDTIHLKADISTLPCGLKPPRLAREAML